MKTPYWVLKIPKYKTKTGVPMYMVDCDGHFRNSTTAVVWKPRRKSAKPFSTKAAAFEARNRWNAWRDLVKVVRVQRRKKKGK